MRQWLLSELKAWRTAIIPGVLVIAAVILARGLGFLQPLEWMALDNLMRHRPTEPTDNRIVVIAIDDQDIAQLRTYPVPDRELAAAITKLQSYQPAAIGLDIFRDLPVEPGQGELLKAFQTFPILFAIEQLPFDDSVAIRPPKGVSPDQVGFANSMPLDGDGRPRRHLLGATDPRYLNTPQASEHYKFSLATQLALRFLAERGYKDEAGQADPETLRLDTVEFPRLRSHTGAYIGLDAGGTQVLLNYRSGVNPFPVLSLRQLRQNQVQADAIHNKIVLIGMNALGAKDFANVAAIPVEDAATYPGVKVQAHAVSQILAAVLDGRPLLRAWIDIVEYLWIGLWGILGIGIGRRLQAPWLILPTVAVVTIGLVGICWAFLLSGWWIPLVPAAMAFLFNGAGLSAGLLYRTKQELATQEALRQAELEQVFNSIHNRPLQRLGIVTRWFKDQPNPPQKLIDQLEQMDLELRSLRHDIGRMAQKQADQIRLGNELFDLNLPLNELLQIVCEVTLRRIEDFPAFEKLKVRLIDIPSDPEHRICDRGLSYAQKDWICRFLEEALCNVGKHGVGVAKVQVFCGKEYKDQVIRVTDDGINQPKAKSPEPRNRISGTQAAKKLEQQLRGTFKRFPNQPQGTICELKWRAK